MARPIKSGLDYFPLDTTLDDRFELIEAKYGPTGFMVVIKLYQKIYATNGYYYPWGEQEQLLFSKRINVDINSINEIIDYCINVGIFSEDMFEKGVLTSHGIQKRYIDATLRRRELTFCSDLLLIDQTLIPVIVGKNTRSIVFISYISTQSKRNEMKRNEIESKATDAINASAIPLSFESICKQISEEWNTRKLGPQFRFTTTLGLNAKEREGFSICVERYSLEEIICAFDNFGKIVINTAEYEAFPRDYRLPGFLTSGVEQYLDDAKPFERCRKRSRLPNGEHITTPEEVEAMLAQFKAEDKAKAEALNGRG